MLSVSVRLGTMFEKVDHPQTVFDLLFYLKNYMHTFILFTSHAMFTYVLK